MINIIQLLTDQRAYEGITHSWWGASWNWRWRWVGDDEEQRSTLRSPKRTPDLASRWRTGGGGGSVLWNAIILSAWFFLLWICDFIVSGLRSVGPRGGDNPPGHAWRGGALVGCAHPGPPLVVLGSRNSYYWYKNPRKVSFHSENFCLCTKTTPWVLLKTAPVRG